MENNIAQSQQLSHPDWVSVKEILVKCESYLRDYCTINEHPNVYSTLKDIQAILQSPPIESERELEKIKNEKDYIEIDWRKLESLAKEQSAEIQRLKEENQKFKIDLQKIQDLFT